MRSESRLFLPPADPALPDLPVLLDGAATAALLVGHLPELRSDRFSIVECVPCYVRYKPGTSALVQYRLRIRDSVSGKVDATTGFFRLYDDDHGAEQWARPTIHRLIERAKQHHPDSLQERAAYFPEMRALWQLYPIDRDLKALVRVAAPEDLHATLRDVLSPERGWPARERGELIRYKPARKALLRVPWEGGVTDAAYVKVLTDDRGSTLVGAAEALDGPGVATPRVVAFHPKRRVIVHEAAGGVPLSALRGTASFTDAMPAVARTLSGLHGCAVPDLHVHSLAAEASVVRIACRTVGVLRPELAVRVDNLATRVTGLLTEQPERAATLHGDFYDDQLLVACDDVTLIDLDEVRLGHPSIDIGNMLAHLSVADARGVATGDARTAFLAAGRSDDAAALPIFEAAALLKLSVGPFRRLEADWPHAMEQIVALAELRLRDVV